MVPAITRRNFVASGAGLAALGITAPALLASDSTVPTAAGAEPYPGFPRQDARLVREVVGKAHTDLDAVRALVEARPALANAWWDWGFGDWESALGAASHMGRRDIAEFLIARGARIDIFAAAMLGQLEAVQSFVKASPGVQRTLGPHGITLYMHAKAGGDAAKPVLDYLMSLGDADPKPATKPLSEEDRAACVGVFSYGPGPDDRFEIKAVRDSLGFLKGEPFPRFLFHVGDLQFFPSGVPHMRINCIREGAAVTKVTLIDHEPILTATRV